MLPELTAQQRRAVFATSLILLFANLLPIIAVLKLDWKVYDILFLYWIETILIGLLNVIRIALINREKVTLGYHLWKIAFAPFFIGHFGLFCLGLGLVLQLIFGKENIEICNPLLFLFRDESARLFWPLMISHLFSFFWIYVALGEFRKSTITKRMVLPYLRVIPINIVFILAALGCLYLSSPRWALMTMVGLKTLTDLIVHLTIHRRTLQESPWKGVITE